MPGPRCPVPPTGSGRRAALDQKERSPTGSAAKGTRPSVPSGTMNTSVASPRCGATRSQTCRRSAAPEVRADVWRCRRRRGAGNVGAPLRDQRIDRLHRPDRHGTAGCPARNTNARYDGTGRAGARDADEDGTPGFGERRAPVVADERQQRRVGGQRPQHLLDPDLGAAAFGAERGALLRQRLLCRFAFRAGASTSAAYCMAVIEPGPRTSRLASRCCAAIIAVRLSASPSSLAPGALRRAAISSRTRARLRTIPSAATGTAAGVDTASE